MMEAVVSFLVTYALHSTLLLGSALLLTRYAVRRESWRDTLWKAALVGGVLSATLVQASPWTRLHVAMPAAAERETVVLGEPSSAPPEPVAVAETEAVGQSFAAESPSVKVQPRSWTPYLVLLYATSALILLLRLAWRHVRLQRALRGREIVADPTLVTMLAELRRGAGVWVPVRLTSCDAIASPLVLGSAEVCVPVRFLTELGAAEQRAALAHELAHLSRRDPQWQLLAMLAESLFFFQPLQRVARRQLRESAEYLADAWAVRQGGERLILARCLAQVAGWVAPSNEPVLAGTVAMAEGGSPLLERVRRLLEREPEQDAPRMPRAVAALVLIAVVAAFGPAVSAVTRPEEPQFVPQGQLEVIRWQERGSLEAGMRWAAAQAGNGTHWVAWSAPAVVPLGSTASTDSDGNVYSGDFDGVAALLGVASDLAVSDRSEGVIVLAGMRDGRLQRLAMASPRNVRLALTGRVYWIGQQPADHSFNWLHGAWESASRENLQEAIIETLGVLAAERAPGFLRDVIASNRSEALRVEAVEELAWWPSDATVELLSRVALQDRNSAVSQEAAETLGEVPHEGSAAALVGIARDATGAVVRLEAVEALAELPSAEAVARLRQLIRESTDTDVVREAVETLGDVGTEAAREAVMEVLSSQAPLTVQLEAIDVIAEAGDERAARILERTAKEHPLREARREALEQLMDLDQLGMDGDALLRIAMTEDDPAMRRDAVERMAALPEQEALRVLRRVAFESGDETTERQAAESLGEIGSEAALALLDEIVTQNPGEGASMEAVGAIAERFSREQAVPLLQRIVRDHPSRKVRREASDYLVDLTGGK